MAISLSISSLDESFSNKRKADQLSKRGQRTTDLGQSEGPLQAHTPLSWLPWLTRMYPFPVSISQSISRVTVRRYHCFRMK